MPVLRKLAAAAGLLALLLACQERLTAPADCPALCPGGGIVLDTVLLLPITDGDSTYVGYVNPGAGLSLLVSNQLPAGDDRALFRFNKRVDSLLDPQDTLRTYAIDSVALEFSMLARDTLVSPVTVYLYRLPATVDSTTTFSQLEASLIPANLVDSFVVDTQKTQRFRTVFSGAELATVDIPAADSGVLALGVSLGSATPTGIRIGSRAAGGSQPTFTSYVRLNIADTANARTISLTTSFSSFLERNPPPVDFDLLNIGGAPSARSLVRFALPAFIRDSAQLVRATLELLPTDTIHGLPGDSAALEVRTILSDLGGKSPAANAVFGRAALADGAADTVRIEVLALVQAWQGSLGLPAAFNLRLSPEGGSFTRAAFGSSRTPQLEPRLRLTFAQPFPFGRP